jgi:hypothetical protein
MRLQKPQTDHQISQLIRRSVLTEAADCLSDVKEPTGSLPALIEAANCLPNLSKTIDYLKKIGR